MEIVSTAKFMTDVEALLSNRLARKRKIKVFLSSACFLLWGYFSIFLHNFLLTKTNLHWNLLCMEFIAHFFKIYVRFYTCGIQSLLTLWLEGHLWFGDYDCNILQSFKVKKKSKCLCCVSRKNKIWKTTVDFTKQYVFPSDPWTEWKIFISAVLSIFTELSVVTKGTQIIFIFHSFPVKFIFRR